MKLVFEKIAKEEGGEYKSIDKSYLGYGLSRTPETKHYLEIVYKGHVIQILSLIHISEPTRPY